MHAWKVLRGGLDEMLTTFATTGLAGLVYALNANSFEMSTEFGLTNGLSLIKGEIKKFHQKTSMVIVLKSLTWVGQNYLLLVIA